MKSIGVVNFSSKPGSVELQEIDRPVAGDDFLRAPIKTFIKGRFPER